MISYSTLNDYKNICNSCTIYFLLFFITFLRIINVSSAIIYFYWYLKSDTSITNINPGTDAVIYSTYKWKISKKLIVKTVYITFLMT